MNIKSVLQIYQQSGPFDNEDGFQVATAKFLDCLMENKALDWFFTGNNIYRRFLGKSAGARAGSKSKRMGSKPGIPDCLIWSHNIAIELKMKKGRLSTSQKEFFEDAEWWGWKCYCCHTPEEVVEAININL